MEIIFSNPQALKYEFQYLISFWALIIFIVYILFATRSPRRWFCALVCAILYGVAVAVSYSLTYSQYMALKTQDSQIILSYVGGDKIVKKSDIKKISMNSVCEIALEAQNRYKSARLSVEENKCREIIRTLNVEILGSNEHHEK